MNISDEELNKIKEIFSMNLQKAVNDIVAQAVSIERERCALIAIQYADRHPDYNKHDADYHKHQAGLQIANYIRRG